MFEFIRTHTKLMLALMVLLIFPSFVFWGVESYSRGSEGATATVAKVDDRRITQQEWDMAHQRAVDRMRQQAPNVDPALLDSPQAKLRSLEALVRQQVLIEAANDAHLFPGDDRLQRLFVSDPDYAAVRNPDGSVNRDILNAQGMTSEAFARQLKVQYGMQQVLGGVAATVLAPKAVADAALDALMQQREVQVERFNAAAYRDQVKPTDAELEAYYKAHESGFRAPEQARIEYVTLTPQALAQDIAVSDDELKAYYQQNAARYTEPEERHARHILIAADKDASAESRAQARARAEQILAEVRAAPDKFGAIARKVSHDPGSAEQGGDLGWFGRGAMVKPFEDAVFALESGQISPVVETDFGFHVIQLVESRGGAKKPFEAVRAQIEALVREQLAQRKYAAAAEQFTNLVYEQSDSLQPVIDRFQLRRQEATVQRNPAPGVTGALASPKLLEAVFGNDALHQQRNTDAVEVGPNELVSARVLKYEPAHTLALTEVRQRVADAVIAERAAELARQAGQARLAAVKADPKSTLPTAATVSRTDPGGQPRAVVEAALGADPGALPVVTGVDLGDQGYVVLRVVAVKPRTPPPDTSEAMLRRQYGQAWAMAEAGAYYDALKTRYKVSLQPPAPAASAP